MHTEKFESLNVSYVTFRVSTVIYHLSLTPAATATDLPLLTLPFCTVGRFVKIFIKLYKIKYVLHHNNHYNISGNKYISS